MAHNRWIPLNTSTLGQEETEAVREVMASGQVTMGYECEQFENEFAAKVGAKHAIFVNSGSSANLLAWFLWANRRFGTLVKGMEVVVPAVSWGTTYWPIIQAGLNLVIVDSNPDTLQMDVDSLEQAIGPNTVAINPVHVLGNAVDMNALKWKSPRLLIVEDACEALGVKYGTDYVGTIGDMGTYSFYFSHHITTIEGGMLVTENDDYADMARMMRSHGWSRASRRRGEYEASNPVVDPDFLFVTTGFNVRPTEINAAIGRIQLKKLDRFQARREQIAAWWTANFQNFGDVFSTMDITPTVKPSAFGFPVICRSYNTRNRLKRWLNINGIETRPIVSGNITGHPAMRGLEYKQIGLLSGANTITNCGLLWGLNPTMSDADVMYVEQKVTDFIQCQAHLEH